MRPRMAVSTRIRVVACLLLAASAGGAPHAAAAQETACSGGETAGLDDFAGSYGAGDDASDAVVSFTHRRGDLLMHPALWSGPMVLRHVAADSFVVSTHPEFGATFVRGSDGCVTGARVRGLSPEGWYGRLDPGSPRPVQLLLNGRPREAARRYVASDPSGTERFVTVGRGLLNFPTRKADAVAFFTELSRLLPEAPAVHAALGDALVFAGERAKATRAYERTLTLDPSNSVATTALTRLGALSAPADSGWQLPFDLDALLAPPRAEEIDSVWARWKRRDLEPREIEVILRRRVDLDGVPAEARVVAHRVHGQRHVGVVVVPEGAAPGALPVLVEAKGVSPSFFPLRVPDGMTSPGLLMEARGRVVYVAPGYRGERVIVGGDTLVSEGNRSDAWDGATDDLIALLRAALEVTPEADTSRVCVFGRSRGGTVALLAGMREGRVDCVVSWAAPTGWFSRMDLMGWTQRELVADGLRNRAIPGETGGQFINYFLSAAIAGRRDLRETRLHLVASSPLYFAERLPLAQVHWGLEDTSVPAVNGRDFIARYRKARRPERCLDVHLHPDAGHDQDRQLAPIRTRAFLLEAFGMSPGRVAACRPRPATAVTGRHSPVDADVSEAEEIRNVVTSAYIDGLHRNGSRDSIRAGFHPSFLMQVFGGDSISSVSIEQWIARLPDPGTPPDHTVAHRIPDVSVSGRAAVARVEVMFDDRHVFTDYMSLYEFEDGWRIVAKIFNAEQR